MGSPSNEEVVRRYVAAHQAHDFDTIGELRHADWLEKFPQTGERVRGHANDLAIMQHWPGGLPRANTLRVTGSEDRWVTTPSNTIHRLVGSGDTWWGDGIASYPDGSSWFASALITLRDGKVHRETWYFGPP